MDGRRKLLYAANHNNNIKLYQHPCCLFNNAQRYGENDKLALCSEVGVGHYTVCEVMVIMHRKM